MWFCNFVLIVDFRVFEGCLKGGDGCRLAVALKMSEENCVFEGFLKISIWNSGTLTAPKCHFP